MLRPGIRRLMRLDLPRRHRIEAELEDELRLHLELRARQLEAQGLAPDAAMAQARARFGPVDELRRHNHLHARRSADRMRRRITIESFLQDLRFAWRTLGRQKSWTAVAVLTLALGIGANTAVVSVVRDLWLDPMRYPHGDRLVLVSRVNVKSGFEMTPTPALMDAWRRGARTIEALEGVATVDRTLDTGTEPATVQAALISPTFTRFAGARLVLGRAFQPDETAKGSAPVVLLSERLWRARFGAAPEVLGSSIALDGTRYRVVGVLADGTRTSSYSTEAPDVWLPLSADHPYLSGPAVARLAPGVTAEAAQQELSAIARGVGTTSGSISGTTFDVAVRPPGVTGTKRQAVVLLAAAVCVLLLIACANVAHLLLARGAMREREMAIRAALGAGRGRIARQLLTESLLLSMAGGIAGLGVGLLALSAIVAQAPPDMGELARVQIDGTVLLLTLGVSLACAVVFGLVAGTQGSRRGFEILRAAGGGSADPRRHRIRSLLVVSESALSVILLVGAALLARTMLNLQQVDPGFDARDVYAMPVSLPEFRYADAANRQLYATRLLDGARRIPGVREATLAANVPTRSGVIVGAWITEGATTARPDEETGFTAMNTVSADYFRVMRMRLTNGRTFDDGSAARNEVVISASFGRQLWGDANPVGKRFRMSGANSPGPWSVVVGTVGDANLLGLREEGRIRAVYFPAAAVPERDFTLIVRTGGEAPTQALRRLALTVDPRMPPPPALSLAELLAHTVATQRFMMTLLSLFAALAVVLCAVGLYGVISYTVNQSTREIGIRIALGATRRDIAGLVMRQGVALSAIGLAVGIGLAVWGTRLLQGSLYRVSSTDPVSYAVGGGVLMLLAVLACVAPTRRALRIDPIVAIRSE